MLKYVRTSTWIHGTHNGVGPHRFVSAPIPMNQFNNEFTAGQWLMNLLAHEQYHVTLELVPPPPDLYRDYADWNETSERVVDGRHCYTLTRVG